MKRIFTLLSVFLLTVALNLSAQTSLSEKEGKAIKEVMPLVFDQLNQQFGIDFLSLTKSETALDGMLKSATLNRAVTGLRASNEVLSIRPDSVIIDIDDIDLTPLGRISEVKLYFEDYATYRLPDVLGAAVDVLLPQKVLIKGGLLSDLKLVLNFEQTGELHSPFGKIDASLAIGTSSYPLLTVAVESLEGSESLLGGFIFSVNMDGMRALKDIPLVGGFLEDYIALLPPYNFQLNVKPDLLKGLVDVSSFVAPVGPTPTPILINETEIALNLESKIYIDHITSKTIAEGEEVEWERTWCKFEEVKDSIIITLDDYSFDSAEMDMETATYEGSTIYTAANGYPAPTNASLVVKSTTSQAVEVALRALASGSPTHYSLLIEEVNKLEEKEISQIITVTPTLGATEAVARVLIADYENGELAETTEIKATARLADQFIKVEFFDGAGNLSATAYFNSNFINWMGNEEIITTQATGLKVAVTDAGLYLLNGGEKGTYTIVDIKGSKLAGGVISGNFIQTPNLNKGIYILLVTDKGKTQAVKFAK